jgi:hypothetical protein
MSHGDRQEQLSMKLQCGVATGGGETAGTGGGETAGTGGGETAGTGGGETAGIGAEITLR